MKDYKKGCLFHTLIIFLVLTAVCWIACDRLVLYMYPFEYQETIQKYAEKYNIDPLLVAAVIREESRFDAEAVSSRQAIGLMQLKYDTAAWAAESIGMPLASEEELYQPEVNIEIGCWYLRQLTDEFDDNVILALAAYNGGGSHVHDWLDSGRWDGTAESISDIPYWETRGFVRKVLNSWYVYGQNYGE